MSAPLVQTVINIPIEHRPDKLRTNRFPKAFNVPRNL
jgi:hypothetical protein